MTDSNGNVIGQQAHYPFGESWYQTNTTTKWFFTDYERDAESGNDYATFRYDVNRLGRFASPDPIAGSRSDPQSLNRYAYVLNDPVSHVDPLGLDCNWTDPDEPCNGGSGVGDSGYDPGAGDGMCSLPDTPCISPYFGPGTSPCSVNGIAVGCGAAAQVVHMGAANPPGEPDTYVEILGPLVPAVLPDFSCIGQAGCGVVLGWQQSVWLLPWNGSPSDVFGFMEMFGTQQGGAEPPPLLGFVPNFPPRMNPAARATKPEPFPRTSPQPVLTPENEPPPELPVENEELKRLLGLIAQFLSGLEEGIFRDFPVPFAVIPQNGYCAIDPASCAVPSETY